MDTIKFLLFSFLSFAVIFLVVEGQFPKVCVNLASLKTRECCPVPAGFTQPCGSDGNRGKCKALTGATWSMIYDHYNSDHDLDDRHNWPRGVFARACRCNSSFAGYDCSKCKFGYHGDECKEKKVLTRKNFNKLPIKEKDQYMRYINMSRYVTSDYVVATTFYQEINETVQQGSDPKRLFANVSYYDFFVWLHYYAARNTFLPDETIKEEIDFAHDGQGFPTWHRLYMLAWERVLQEVSGDDTFMVPYWDWTKSGAKCEMCTEELLGKTAADGQVTGTYFNDWYVICSASQIDRSVKNGTRICDPRDQVHGLKRTTEQEKRQKEAAGYKMDFPTKEDVNFALRFEQFDLPPFDKQSSCNFRNILEGYVSTDTGYRSLKAHNLHNQVHIAVGGIMGDVPSASNDPIFLLHHSFVDRIFEQWLRKYKKNEAVLSATEAPIGHNRDAPIVPLFPVYTHEEFFKESFEFGYDYEDMDKNGGSPGVEEQASSSLGRCPVPCAAATKSVPGSSVGWKIAAGIFAGILVNYSQG